MSKGNDKKINDAKLDFLKYSKFNPKSERYSEEYLLKNPITYEFWKMICSHAPYDFFITVTFKKNTKKDIMEHSTKEVIKRYNRKLLGTNYKTKNYIKGYVFIEDKPSERFGDRLHVHMIIKATDKFDEDQHMDIFYKAILSIKDGDGINKKRLVFNRKCIDIQPVYFDEGVVDYCFKDIWDRNIMENLKVIDKSGFH